MFKSLNLRKGKNAYPILGKCNCFDVLVKNLSDDDLQYVENTLTEYEKGNINIIFCENGCFQFTEKNIPKFGGIRLAILKWFENKLKTEELIEEITTLPF